MADVLDAPRHRPSEAEGNGRDQRAGPVPASVAKPGEQSHTTAKHRGQHRGINGPQARPRIDQRQQQERRGKNHRLRVGDLHLTGKHEGIPERPLAARQAIGQKLDLRLEMGFGIPGNRDPPGKPRPCHRDKAGRECKDNRPQQPRRALFRPIGKERASARQLAQTYIRQPMSGPPHVSFIPSMVSSNRHGASIALDLERRADCLSNSAFRLATAPRV